MIKKISLIVFLFTVLFLSSCSDDDDKTQNDLPTTYLDNATVAGTVSKSLLSLILESQGFGEFATLLNGDITVYRITYYTEYPHGTKIKASGILILPNNYDSHFPTVIYNHGTIDKEEAPSLLNPSNVSTYTLEPVLGMTLSSVYNCAVLLPDYVGYGSSDKITHPYIHKESLGQAGLDMIRAYEEYAGQKENNITFNNEIFITGYSEGGNACLALHELIQKTPQANLHIVKTVSGSGAYDNVAFAKEFLSKTGTQDKHMVSSYLWGFNMYKVDYKYSKNFSQIFSSADNALLKATNYDLAYFHPENLNISTNPELLFQSDFIKNVLDEKDSEFINILKENSFSSFVPQDSIIFVYGNADNFVYPVNTINTYNSMKDKGGKVLSYEIPGTDHTTTFMPYLNIVMNRLNQEKQ